MTNGAGVIFYARDTNRHLYLLRNDSKHPNTWGIVGGKCERGESLRDTIERECYEEVGFKFAGHKLFPIECFTTPDDASNITRFTQSLILSLFHNLITNTLDTVGVM
jgi:8-oxo-dGTP pyrophosphatase MutT (NUDIX family)